MPNRAYLKEFNLSESATPDHFIEGYTVTLRPGDRIIPLPQSMFFNSLYVILHGEKYKVSNVSDLAISCIDTYSQSMISHVNPAFTGRVVKSLKYIGRLKEPLVIAVSGYTVDQVFKPSEENFDEYTERAARSIMTDIDSLSLGCESFNFVRAKTLAKAVPLKLDTTGKSRDNFVSDEKHHVNHSENRVIIQPISGDFYAENLKVSFDGKQLIEGVDYSIGNIKINKQLFMGCGAPIYGKILIRAKITGVVTIQYQALGGDSGDVDLHLLEVSFIQHDKRISGLEIRTEALEQRNTQLDTLDVMIRELHDKVETMSKIAMPK